ncbi:TPR repeat-containing protein [Calothrix sp. NIES-2100]|uniref:CHAT domain-containing protein n=1 Tax=Calothrix sp. NIES-2100 TaxID=1954172 RepID=UPI000B60A5C8|nr:TPR repeat-containing protein [Calothrix sp. NIES-2100]
MKIHKIALLTLITLLITIGQAPINHSAIVGITQVLAQNPSAQKAEADRLFNQGKQQYQTSQFEAALRSWQQALIIYREIKDRKSEENALGNLGNAYLYLGNYKKAIDHFQHILAIAQQIKDRQGEGNALGGIGLAYLYLGDYKKTIDYFQQNLAIAQQIKDRQGEGNALGNLGIAYSVLGEYPKAIDYHQQHLAITREMKDRQGESNALGNLGIAYRELGGYKKAIEYQQQSLEIAREIKDRFGEGGTLGSIGIAYYFLGDYKKAIDYYQQSLAILREIKNRQGEGLTLGNIGSAYNTLGDYKTAIDYHEQHLAIAREIQDRNGEGSSLQNLGLTFYKQGNLLAAEKTLYEGITVVESLRDKKLADTDKISLFDAQSTIYRDLQKVLIAQNKTDAALEIAERGRARAFVELLASRVSTNNKQAYKSPQPPTISEIKQIAQQQNATLVQYSIIYDDFKVTGKEQTKESDLYIWVVKPTGEVTFRKVDIKPLWQKDNTTLDKLVTQGRLGIGVVRGGRAGGIIATQNPDAANVKKPLQKLHDILIKDIADLLPKNPNERVIFIPQSSLFLAPFPALRDEQGKYLIEKHTILTAPAIQVLDFTHQLGAGRQTNYNNALIVGNPTMPVVSTEPGKSATRLDPLPGAELEAKTIAKMLKTQAILGKDATKANILQRLSSVDVIHLATHGWADDNRGLGSWIAFAPSLNDDGLLTAEEILDLKLKAQLVVLSACETGKGKLSGDGVIGLSRSLISAGVPSVLVSLWQVADEPTQYLMVEFYKSLQTQPDKALALRQAMLKTKEKFPNPVNWAAFTLIGER